MTEVKARVGNGGWVPFPAFEWNRSRMGKMPPGLNEVNKITEKVKLKKTLTIPLRQGMPTSLSIQEAFLDPS